MQELVQHVGQQSDLTGALNGGGQLTLMHRAGAGGAMGQDLAALGDIAAQLLGVLRSEIKFDGESAQKGSSPSSSLSSAKSLTGAELWFAGGA